jgi:hypothetical protein
MSLDLLEIAAHPLEDPAIRFLRRAAAPRLPDYGFGPQELSAIRMPSPLRRLYEYAGRWPGLYSQNRLLAPNQLKVGDGKLIFFDESQHAAEWATDTEDTDGTVWFREPGPMPSLPSVSRPHGPWQKEPAPLSFFLLETLLCEYALVWSPAGAYAQPASAAELERVLESFTALPFGQFGPWPMRFFLTNEIVAQVDPQGFAWLGAASEDAIRALPLDEIVWDVYSRTEPD